MIQLQMKMEMDMGITTAGSSEWSVKRSINKTEYLLLYYRGPLEAPIGPFRTTNRDSQWGRSAASRRP